MIEKDVMELNFQLKFFKDQEPKLTYEETIIEDDGSEKGDSVYVSDRILVVEEGKLFTGRFRKRISNYDNRVESLYIDIETSEVECDRLIKENYIVPRGETKWAYISL